MPTSARGVSRWWRDLPVSRSCSTLRVVSFIATVQNDTIKLPPGVHLPDGTQVTVEPREAPPKSDVTPQALYESMREFIGCVDTGLGDLAQNHDHYLYGTPKRPK